MRSFDFHNGGIYTKYFFLWGATYTNIFHMYSKVDKVFAFSLYFRNFLIFVIFRGRIGSFIAYGDPSIYKTPPHPCQTTNERMDCPPRTNAGGAKYQAATRARALRISRSTFRRHRRSEAVAAVTTWAPTSSRHMRCLPVRCRENPASRIKFSKRLRSVMGEYERGTNP